LNHTLSGTALEKRLKSPKLPGCVTFLKQVMIQENRITWLEVHYWYWKLKHSRRVDVSATKDPMNRKKNPLILAFVLEGRATRCDTRIILYCHIAHCLQQWHNPKLSFVINTTIKFKNTKPKSDNTGNHREIFLTTKCVGTVGFSCYICFLNCRINPKWLFLSCIQ
jgi:hypothetical protein